MLSAKTQKEAISVSVKMDSLVTVFNVQISMNVKIQGHRNLMEALLVYSVPNLHTAGILLVLLRKGISRSLLTPIGKLIQKFFRNFNFRSMIWTDFCVVIPQNTKIDDWMSF